MDGIWILVLVGLGVGLLLAEIFMPGVILGVLGGICLVASVVLSFKTYGSTVGSFVLVGEVIGVGIGLFWTMQRLPSTRFGRSVMLEETNEDLKLKEEFQKFVGQNGKVVSLCRPLGVALILGKRVDVQAENGFLEVGTEIEVTRVEGSHIWVKKGSKSVESM